jgi:O-antigen/teichoic acid export membrane protein
MSEESLKHKTVKGASWSFIDSIAGQGITFLVGLVLARLLTPEEYGLIGIITIFIAVFNCIVDSGFSNALIRKNDAKDIDYNTVFITNLALSVVLFGALYVSAPAISHFFNQPQLIPLLRVMGIIVIINAFAIIQRTILVKKVYFKTQTKVSLISSISSGVVGIGMALNGLGVWSLVGQQISRQFLNTAFLWVYSKWFPKFQFSIYSFKELFTFGWKLLVSSLIDTVWREIYQVVIGKCYTPVALGQYTRAQQFASIFSSNLTTVIQRVSFPVLSSVQDDKERLKSGYRRIIKVSMLITFALMLELAAVAKPLVLALIGEQWLPCVPFLQIICLQMMLYPLHSLNLNMLQVQGRSDLFLRLEIIKKIIAIGPLFFGIFVNIYWMLGSSVVTGLIAYYLNAYYSGPFLNYSIKEQIKDILPSFGVSMMMAIPVFAMSFIPLNPIILLSLQIILGAAITIGICEATKLPEYLEIKGIAMPIINKIIKRK